MYNKNRDLNGIMRIIINNQNKIQYSSVDSYQAYDLIRKMDILNKISEGVPAQYDLGDYYVTIDKFYIYNQAFYIIVIYSMHCECINCQKALIDSITGLYNRNYWEQIFNGERFYFQAKYFSYL